MSVFEEVKDICRRGMTSAEGGTITKENRAAQMKEFLAARGVEKVSQLPIDAIDDLREILEAWKAEDKVGTTQTVLAEIESELTRAREKFPGKNVTFAALGEEFGELATALFEEPRANVRKEAIQVAVMAMRIILDGDHTFDAWRAEKGLDPLVAEVSL